MKNSARSATAAHAALGLTVLALSGLFSRAISQPMKDPAGEPAVIETKAGSGTPESVIAKWPEAARVTARAMIVKYGEPNRYTKNELVWLKNGPWEKTVVHRSAWPHLIGKMDKDYLEQTVSYRVPREKVGELRRFDGRLEISESRRQMTARSQSEPMNFLALNLAGEIAAGKRSVESARDLYGKTEKLSKAGKSSPYLEGFLFPTRDGGRAGEFH